MKPEQEYQTRMIELPRIAGETELERLIARSRLIGADPRLVVHGGGNTSSKIREIDYLGRERTVLRIKGSGADLKTIGSDGFPGLYLDELLPLRERAAMSDEEMVAYLAHCMAEPGGRRPSIETLLHAFLPAAHVDHVHADAICTLTNAPDVERHVREALGPDVAVVPYIRPGFALSKQVAELSGAYGVVLAKHGLVTWGDDHETSYGRTVELVARANDYLAGKGRSIAAEETDDLADSRSVLLRLRGQLSSQGRQVLTVDRDQCRLADRPDLEQVATAGRATPDHILRIGARSLAIRDPFAVEQAIETFSESSLAYFARHRQRLPHGLRMLSPLPRVALVRGLGCVAAGPNIATARMNAEIAARSHGVTARVLDAFDEVEWLSESDIFDFDYWPLELAKLQSAPPPAEFSGHVAVIAGAGSTLGRATADRLARDGAHLVLSGGDAAILAEIQAALPPYRAVIATGDPFEAAIDAFGGIDLFVALEPAAPDQLDRLAQLFRVQGLGGVIVGCGNPETATIDLTAGRGPSVRANLVAGTADAPPALIAEAVAFLASPRSAGTDRSSMPVSGLPA